MNVENFSHHYINLHLLKISLVEIAIVQWKFPLYSFHALPTVTVTLILMMMLKAENTYNCSTIDREIFTIKGFPSIV